MQIPVLTIVLLWVLPMLVELSVTVFAGWGGVLMASVIGLGILSRNVPDEMSETRRSNRTGISGDCPG